MKGKITPRLQQWLAARKQRRLEASKGTSATFIRRRMLKDGRMIAELSYVMPNPYILHSVTVYTPIENIDWTPDIELLDLVRVYDRSKLTRFLANA